ncbi:hypothetical protein RQ765_21065, partial [Roseomonas mucosa]
LCGCGHNIRKILAHLRALLLAFLASLVRALTQTSRHPALPATAAALLRPHSTGSGVLAG